MLGQGIILADSTVLDLCANARAGISTATDCRTGENTAKSIQTNLCSVLCEYKTECFCFAFSLFNVCLDRLIPFALVCGDHYIRKQIDNTCTCFFTAFGKGVLNHILECALGHITIQPCTKRNIFHGDFGNTCNRTQSECLCIVQASVLCRKGHICCCTATHNAQRQGLVSTAYGSCEQEVSHAHAGIIGKTAYFAPFSTILNGRGHLRANCVGNVHKLIVACIFIDLTVNQHISGLPNIGQSF